jgi:hypothetical protein
VQLQLCAVCSVQSEVMRVRTTLQRSAPHTPRMERAAAEATSSEKRIFEQADREVESVLHPDHDGGDDGMGSNLADGAPLSPGTARLPAEELAASIRTQVSSSAAMGRGRPTRARKHWWLAAILPHCRHVLC